MKIVDIIYKEECTYDNSGIICFPEDNLSIRIRDKTYVHQPNMAKERNLTDIEIVALNKRMIKEELKGNKVVNTGTIYYPYIPTDLSSVQEA